MTEDLELPDNLYALDKSVRLMSLLDEVTFEIMEGTGDRDGGGDNDEKTVRVTCRFGDGALEEWSVTTGAGLISALDGIVNNVQESTLENDKEFERYRKSQLQNNRSRASNRLSMPTGLIPMTGTKPRHKKQRSLFMQIVTYVGVIFYIIFNQFYFS